MDWFNLFANALWIVALALALAILSYASWQAAANEERMGAVLSRPGYQRWFYLAGIVFCSGLALTSTGYQTIVWAVLGGCLFVLLVMSYF